MRRPRFSALLPATLLALAACGDEAPVSPGEGGAGGGAGGASGSTVPSGGAGGGGGSTVSSTSSSTSSSGGAEGGAGGAGAAGGAGSAGEAGGGVAAPYQLADGTWTLDRVSQTDGTISHDGAIGFLPNGMPLAVWAEPDSVDVDDADLFWATFDGSAWQPQLRLTDEEDVQFAYPVLASGGGKAFLAYSGYPNPGKMNEVFVAAHDGSGWAAPVDLTGAFETASSLRQDVAPSLALLGGGVAAVFESWPVDAAAKRTGPTEIRLVRFEDGTSGPPELVMTGPTIQEVQTSCYAPSVVADSKGHLHVVADCGAVFDEDLLYATNAFGSWKVVNVTSSAGTDDVSPSLALGPDGESLHLAWTSTGPCGSGSCTRVLYAQGSKNGFGAPKPVSGDTDEPAFDPKLAVDPYGRPILAFFRRSPENYMDVFATFSENGGATFAAPENLTKTPDADEWFTYSMVIHPETGLPHFSFTKIFAATDPLNTEVFRAHLTLP